jgi:hypothetical protein
MAPALRGHPSSARGRSAVLSTFPTVICRQSKGVSHEIPRLGMNGGGCAVVETNDAKALYTGSLGGWNSFRFSRRGSSRTLRRAGHAEELIAVSETRRLPRDAESKGGAV